MAPWDIWTWDFPGLGEHPAVLLTTPERAAWKSRISVLVCTARRATRKPELHEILLDEADGLDCVTLCKCDLVYVAEKSQLTRQCGQVTPARQRAIAERVIRCLGLAGL